jgi:hypothetical protein
MLLTMLAVLLAAAPKEIEATVAVVPIESGLCGVAARGAVVGMVFDDNGRPVSAQVSADFGKATSNSLVVSDTGAVADTDERGRFEFSFKDKKADTIRWLGLRVGGFPGRRVDLRLGVAGGACVLVRLSGLSGRVVPDAG